MPRPKRITTIDIAGVGGPNQIRQVAISQLLAICIRDATATADVKCRAATMLLQNVTPERCHCKACEARARRHDRRHRANRASPGGPSA